MENKHMKRSSTSMTIRKMQIKTTVKYHHTSIIIAKIKNSNSAGKDEETLDLSYIAYGNAK